MCNYFSRKYQLIPVFSKIQVDDIHLLESNVVQIYTERKALFLIFSLKTKNRLNQYMESSLFKRNVI